MTTPSGLTLRLDRPLVSDFNPLCVRPLSFWPFIISASTSLRRCLGLPLLMMLACAFFPAHAGTWVLDPATAGQPIGRQMRYLEDPDGRMQLDEVMRREAEFKPSEKSAPNFGFTKSVYWFAVRLENQAASNSHWILEHGYPHVDHLTFYLVRDGMVVATYENGRSLPFIQRALKHRNMTLPLELKPGEHVDLYARVKTESSLQMPMAAWTDKDLAAKDHEEQIALGIYYGVLIAMFVFNAMVYMSIRVNSYLHYVQYIGGYIAFQLTLNGLAYEYLWPALPRWNTIALPLFIAFALQGMVNFARSFLSVSTHLPRLGRAMQWHSWFLGSLVVASFVAPYSFLIKITTVNALIATLFVMAASTICLIKGVREARYFLLAWVTLLCGIAIYVLKTFNLMPTNFVTEYGLQIGSAFETVLLSFALAHRMKILEEENRRIQAEAKEELEQRVSQRTSDLNRALKDLSEAHSVLQQVNQQDGLTCAKNRKYFDQQLTDEIKRGARTNLPLSLLLIDVDHFKRINDTHGHLAGDECLRVISRAIRSCLQRTGDEVARYGGEEFAVMLPNTDAAGVLHLAEHIRKTVASLEIQYEMQRIALTVSVGVCTVHHHNLAPQHLLATADAALYRAKHEGRDCVRVGLLDERSAASPVYEQA